VNRCERHDLALAADGTCVVCRREASQGREVQRTSRSRLRILLAIMGAALVALFVVVLLPQRHETADAIHDLLGPAVVTGPLHTRYATGRSGAFLLPPGFEDNAVPLLVVLHGTGGSGSGTLPLVKRLAIARRFAVVAPDSELAEHWEVPDHPGETTKDSEHVVACVRELRAMAHVVIDSQHVLVAGISGGGSTAPYEASTYDDFTAFAVLHGGVFAGGLGPRRVPGWFSTGQQDPLRPVASVSKATDAVRALGFDVGFHTYPGGHEVSSAELSDLLRWWLGE
jgi:phospholipase/carboxylesterase